MDLESAKTDTEKSVIDSEVTVSDNMTVTDSSDNPTIIPAPPLPFHLMLKDNVSITTDNVTVDDNVSVNNGTSAGDNVKIVSEKSGLLDELRGAIKDKYINFDSDGETYSDVEDDKKLPLTVKVDNSDEKDENEIAGKSKEEILKRISSIGVSIAPIPKPIFFKTSIKKDPGSKLQDELVKELETVLMSRDGANIKEIKNNQNKTSYKPVKKPQSVRKMFDSNVLANLENHFLNRTMQKKIEKERPSVKEMLSPVESFHEKAKPSDSSHEKPKFLKNTSVTSKLHDKSIKRSNLSRQNSFESYTASTLEYSFPKLKQQWIKKDNKYSSHKPSVQNNISKQSNDSVFQYGLRNGVMYTANVKVINDEEMYSTVISISGCPYIQNIDDGGLPTATGDGLYSGEENKNASFSVDVSNRVGDLGVKVEGPNSIAKTTLEQKEGRYIVSYVPVEVGVFTLVVTWNGKDIPGSPFHPKVVNPHKVEVVGGWQQILDNKDRVHLVVGEPKHIAFDISEAGPGHLTSEVTGPASSLHSVIEATGSAQVTMTFTPEQEGNHYIHLQWSKLALPKSPLLGYAVHGRQDNKVILTGRGLKEASVREEAEFNIDGTQAGPGTPEVTLTGVKAEIPVKVIAIAQGKYRCQYVPVIPGAYLLNITWNNRQLRGSPYKVNVIGAFYPNKVTVSGEGLTGGIAGRSLNVTIDTRKAGPGELTASCMGPNKAAYCELEDNRDGTFELRIKPQEIGRHVLQVKYGGEHVQGSPFIIKVSAPPDASKVRVTGPGVEHGILAKFQSKFIVETKGAGAGQLTVRVRGPKGSFRVEMKRDSQRDRTILCQYYPTEIGDYHISVKWSSVDVPGSPFLVHIVDTMAELEEVMRSSMSAGRQPTPRSYDEWREKL